MGRRCCHYTQALALSLQLLVESLWPVLSCTVILRWFRYGLSQAKFRLKFSCQHNGIREAVGALKRDGQVTGLYCLEGINVGPKNSLVIMSRLLQSQ